MAGVGGVAGGSISAADVGFNVDMELVIARMKNMDADMHDLTDIYREAVKPIWTAYRGVVPVDSGHMKQMVRKTASQFGGTVYLNNTGRMNKSIGDYVGVVEFGGTIPVPHAKRLPNYPHRRRIANPRKPWIGGPEGTSYYLYPTWDAGWKAIIPPFIAGLKKLCAKYLPK